MFLILVIFIRNYNQIVLNGESVAATMDASPSKRSGRFSNGTRRRFLRTLGGLGTIGLAGCLGSSGNGPSSTATQAEPSEEGVTDATGRTVTIPDAVEDVVALGPGTLNLVAYLDAVDMIAGVEESEHTWARNNPYNIANPSLQEKPVIGPHKGGDAELIADVDPDVVLASYFTAGTAKDLQSKIDTPVVVVKASSRPLHRLEKMFGDLRLAAEVLGRQDRAETVIEFFDAEREGLAKRTDGIPEEDRVPVYFAGRSSSGGAGATSTQHPLAAFSFVNANNVADSIEGHASVSEEKLLTWDPAAIFVAESNLDRVKEALAAAQYASLSAVENDAVYGLLPTRFYGNLYGSSLANAYSVGSILYPEAFEDVDPASKADEIYLTLHGTEVYEALTANFGAFKRTEQSQ